jgi:hypothetical protein
MDFVRKCENEHKALCGSPSMGELLGEKYLGAQSFENGKLSLMFL